MDIKEFLKVTEKYLYIGEINFQDMRPRIFCKDGASVSVQGSSTMYCTPRRNGHIFSTIEAGYPTVEPPDSWLEYAEGYDYDRHFAPLQTVYAYMPIELAQEFIDLHGGIDEDKTFSEKRHYE